MSIEDPIVTYDSVVTQMITNGVEWIPPDQIAKGFSEVLSIHPDSAQSQNIDGSDDVSSMFVKPNAVVFLAYSYGCIVLVFPVILSS